MNDLKMFFDGFQKGMKDFGSNINLIVNSILLLIVYLVGVGITSLLAKLSGKHFLERKISLEKKTYWSDLNLKKKELEKYYRQF